jgi:hypothetical protein
MPIRHPVAFCSGSSRRDLHRDGARAGSQRRFLDAAAGHGSGFRVDQRSDVSVAWLGFSDERVLDWRGRPGIGGRRRSILELVNGGLVHGVREL